MYRYAKKQLIFLILFFVLITSSLQAQVGANMFRDHQLNDSIIAAATEYLGASSLLYTGSEYIGYKPGIKGHPYYFDEGVVTGSVLYDGIVYKSAPLKYDIVQDELILFPSGNNVPIKLLKEKIFQFQLGNEMFIKMVNDSTVGGSGASAFYQLLNRGTVTAVAQLKKQILESRRMDEASRFVQYERYFLKKDGLYYPVNKNSDILALMKDKRDEIRKFQRSEKLNFRKSPIETIKQTAVYYSQITR
jgi:hypothetical protein